MDRNATDLESMGRIVFRDGSKFAMDGEILLANEFRADATVNRTLLRAIANGVTRRDELQNLIGPVSVSGYLSRLENQFELIAQTSRSWAKIIDACVISSPIAILPFGLLLFWVTTRYLPKTISKQPDRIFSAASTTFPAVLWNNFSWNASGKSTIYNAGSLVGSSRQQ